MTRKIHLPKSFKVEGNKIKKTSYAKSVSERIRQKNSNRVKPVRPIK